MSNELLRLDEIAREAWDGNYERVGVLSTGERLYVALASGRMRELCPSIQTARATVVSHCFGPTKMVG